MDKIFIYMLAEGVAESIDRTTPLSERMATGLEVTLLGMGTCIAVLSILWGILTIFKLVFYHPEKQTKTEVAPAPEAQPIEMPVEEEKEDETELIAAITGAIQCCLEAESKSSNGTGFRVVLFKKINKKF